MFKKNKILNFTGRINAFRVIELLQRINISGGQNTESVNSLSSDKHPRVLLKDIKPILLPGSSPQMHSEVELLRNIRCFRTRSDELFETEDFCDETFYSTIEPTNHLAKRHVEKSEDKFFCRRQNCFGKEREYDSKKLFEEHVKSHSWGKHYQCSYEGCNMRFFHGKSLRRHISAKHAEGQQQITNTTVNVDKNDEQNLVVPKQGL